MGSTSVHRVAPANRLGSPADDGELHAVALFGLLPARLATGLGSDVQRPLATVIVWGLLSATRLTLLVLPVLDEIVRQAVPLRNTRRSGIQIVEIGGNRSPNLVE